MRQVWPFITSFGTRWRKRRDI